MRNLLKNLRAKADIQDESGHTAAWGGGGLLTIVVIVLLLIWLF